MRLRYRSKAGQETDRTVWPVILGYAEASRLLVAWCELRQSFRHFRTDRIVDFEVLDETRACGTANCDAGGNDGARRTSAFLRETETVAIGT
jgi:predicted DNA-binding transcriptional regulator YafY